MADHRGPRRPWRPSTFLRVVLALGLAAGLFVTGTYAFWTDEVTITGTGFTSGTIDLEVNDTDAWTTTTLGMSAASMVPGATSAEVLTVKNGGTAPLTYTLTGGLTGTDAATFSAAGALKLTIVSGGSRAGSGNAVTCVGGTTIVGPTALTSTTTTAILATRRGPIAPAGTEALCFQITFDAGAPSSLQAKTASATFTATGTSDVA